MWERDEKFEEGSGRKARVGGGMLSTGDYRFRK